VTENDINRFGGIVAELAQAHCVGVSTAGRWGAGKSEVAGVAEAYEKAVGKAPKWHRMAGGARYPAAMMEANKRGMCCVFWSTYLELDASGEGVEDAVGLLKGDIKGTRGGNIVCVRKKGAAGKGTLAADLCSMLDLLGAGGGVKLEGLDVVVKMDHEFVLE
jgi:hypothetical protein